MKAREYSTGKEIQTVFAHSASNVKKLGISCNITAFNITIRAKSKLHFSILTRKTSGD